MLKPKEIQEIKKIVEKSENPIIFYDNDPDGLCSYLLFKKHFQKGTGIRMHDTRNFGELHLKKIQELNADLVVILDIYDVNQDFIDETNLPILWIDHHGPFKRKKVNYYNPRVHDKNVYESTSSLMYQITKENLWLAAIGSLSDWELPSYIEEFIKKYPDLINLDIKYNKKLSNEEKAKIASSVIYSTKFGKLIQDFGFLLNGPSREVRKSVNILLKIENPYEIIEEKTPKGKYLSKKTKAYNEKYSLILKRLLKTETKEGILVFYYADDKDSFTAKLANESSYKKPDDFIIIAREKNNEMKMSLRWRAGDIRPILKKATAISGGSGGGHKNACGAIVKADKFNMFLDVLKEELNTIN